MITSSTGFLIGTPTKCGTTTLEATAKRFMRNNPADADLFRIMDWDKPRRQHRMALPPFAEGHSEWDEGRTEGDAVEWGDVDRYLFVRNPYTRYMSIYTYLSAPANYSQWGARDIQGREWGGNVRLNAGLPDKMTFEQFLLWLAKMRARHGKGHSLSKRGDFRTGKAYRSPWVWTDSLTTSLDLLRAQPGGEASGEVSLLKLELIDANDGVEGSLAWLLRKYGLIDDVLLGGLHSNRSTQYGADGANPGAEEFWGGIEHSVDVFRGRTWRPGYVVSNAECPCAACVIGVAGEAADLGYLQ